LEHVKASGAAQGAHAVLIRLDWFGLLGKE
jgi:hypothetical protein